MRKQASTTIVRALVALASLGAIVWAFFLVGSPAQNRKLLADSTRLKDLQCFRRDINRYHKKFSKLPDSLEELETLDWSYCNRKKDPLSKESYSYRVRDSSHFELCAEFALPSPEPELSHERYYSQSRNDEWKHPAGRHCFGFTS